VKILAIHAHPDDIEFLAGGTLALLAEANELTLATFTPGDCGSADLSREEIARVRRAEAQASASLLDAQYVCLEERDLEIEVTNELRRKVTELVRRELPDLVITASPNDYMADHERASACVRDACFNAPVPIYETGVEDPAAPADRVPHLFYVDPIELTDAFGAPVTPHFVVDISDRIERKTELLACHASQREWLRRQHGLDAYLSTMRQWSAARGALAGVAFAEGFRQHRGHAYPPDNVLERLLAGRITALS
jgi:LmbE family N-acetylglucosaminyl deacetylase